MIFLLRHYASSASSSTRNEILPVPIILRIAFGVAPAGLLVPSEKCDCAPDDITLQCFVGTSSVYLKSKQTKGETQSFYAFLSFPLLPVVPSATQIEPVLFDHLLKHGGKSQDLSANIIG